MKDEYKGNKEIRKYCLVLVSMVLLLYDPEKEKPATVVFISQNSLGTTDQKLMQNFRERVTEKPMWPVVVEAEDDAR